MRRYEDFSVVTRDSLVYTLRTLGLKYDTKVFERIMNKAMFKALRMQRDELGLTPDYRVRGLWRLSKNGRPYPDRRHQPYVINEYRFRGYRFSGDVRLAG